MIKCKSPLHVSALAVRAFPQILSIIVTMILFVEEMSHAGNMFQKTATRYKRKEQCGNIKVRMYVLIIEVLLVKEEDCRFNARAISHNY